MAASAGAVAAAAAVTAVVAAVGVLIYATVEETKAELQLEAQMQAYRGERAHARATAQAKAKAAPAALPHNGRLVLEDEDANEELVDRQRREEARKSGSELGQAKSKPRRDDAAGDGGVGVPPRAPGFVPATGEEGRETSKLLGGIGVVTSRSQSTGKVGMLLPARIPPRFRHLTLSETDSKPQPAKPPPSGIDRFCRFRSAKRSGMRRPPASIGGRICFEQQARGRWVESRVKAQFPELKWQAKGVDAVDPKTGVKYEVLSGARSNVDAHAKRMSQETFRMIKF